MSKLLCHWLLACSTCLLTTAALAVDDSEELSVGVADDSADIRIGIPSNRPPYAYLSASKQPQGLLVDAIKKTCQRMKAACNFTTGNFDALLLDLQGLKLNAIVVIDSFIMPAVDNVMLTRPLCRVQPTILQNKSTPPRSTLNDYRGVRVAVLEGSLYHLELLDEYSNVARLRPYPMMDSAIFDLAVGRVDVILADEAFIRQQVMDTALASYANLTTQPFDLPNLPSTSMVLAFRAQDTAMLKTLEAALPSDTETPTCTQLLTPKQAN